ncbi:hypothetical protein MIMGU_mgv1a010210mg [Erythranthe guttata]|uniref:Ionotropic glutamate receptor C-terminal domain-containing protein n=1 Tax=Erythranthe guttata TaxID=4155 RepID=A0A022RD29_ERYGU|nr:PREDICTED: glutamate receptor 2.9-like [Erythranthe guttata]EYU38151.1 hypothetical protein MIMGU_mgv1a010210mg [Erythranthe guttata]|eukprot:XP_012836570.1 PREDICTED: glutamate receptor 2.9-like [Erythranthe guttata]
MVVPVEDDKRGNKSLFLKPLTRNMWFLTVASFVSIGIMVYIFERPINKEFRGPLGYELGMIFWFPVSTVFFAHREKVVRNSARFVLIVWFFAVFVLTQSYSASLTSMLTVQKLQPTVTDINVLIRNKEKVGYSHTSFIFGFLKSKFNESQLISFDTSEQMDELLSKGSSNGGIAAAFHEIPYIKLFLGKYCSKYMLVGPTYKSDGFGFVFPKDSPLIPDVSRTVLNVTEGQKMVEIEERWLGDKTKCVDPDTLLRPEGLGVSSFQIIFYLVAAIGLATITKYILEYRCKKPEIKDDERPVILANIHELHKLLTKFNNRN